MITIVLIFMDTTRWFSLSWWWHSLFAGVQDLERLQEMICCPWTTETTSARGKPPMSLCRPLLRWEAVPLFNKTMVLACHVQQHAKALLQLPSVCNCVGCINRLPLYLWSKCCKIVEVHMMDSPRIERENITCVCCAWWEGKQASTSAGWGWHVRDTAVK